MMLLRQVLHLLCTNVQGVSAQSPTYGPPQVQYPCAPPAIASVGVLDRGRLGIRAGNGPAGLISFDLTDE